MFFAFPLFRVCWLSGFIFGASWLLLVALFAAFWLQVGVLGRPLPPKSASWESFRRPSWASGGSWGVQVGFLGRLGVQVGLLARILTSKLASWASFWPPSWPPGPAFGLKVGLLVWLWASKLACWAAFVNRPFEFEFFDHIYLRRNGGMRGAFE